MSSPALARASFKRAAATLALPACIALAGCGSTSHRTVETFAGAAFTPAPLAPAFTLTDLHGARVSLSSLRGQVVVVAFLDSACRPGCVLVAQQLRGALDELAHPPAALIVTIDPAADTPGSVQRFLRSVSLEGRVRWLVGPPAELRAVWHGYRIVTPAADAAAFESALSVVLIDRQGRERVLFQPEQLTPEGLAHDLRSLQREPASP